MNKEVSLCFTALILTTIAGLPIANKDYLEAILIDINILLNMLPNAEGTFYTPKNTGVKCIRADMECFMYEMDVLKEENDDNRNITNIIQKIQRNVRATWKPISETDANAKGCPPCESHEGQNYADFLDHMIKLVQFAFRTGL